MLTAVAPKITGSRSNTELSVMHRHPVKMECDVSGVPPPEVTWTKDGVDISEGGGHGGGVLQLAAALVDDAGLYVCTASNVAGMDRKRYRLQVLGTFLTL